MKVCPQCNTRNEDTARHCVGCKTRLRRRERASEDEPLSVYAENTDPINRPSVKALYWSLWGLIPLLGILLGPLALLLAWRAYRSACRAPNYQAAPHAILAMVLGTAEALTQSLGVLFIYWGLTT